MPSFVAFQFSVMIQNLVIHRCIIDEGESTCVMSTFVWQKIGSPTLQPSSTAPDMYFHFPRPPTDGNTKVLRFPFRRVVNNATARDVLNYSIVDCLDQSPTAMSSLEVLKVCPSQHKSLLSTLGSVYPYDSRLITFDLDQGEPRMPSSVSFQVSVMIQNLVIHRCIIDEGESTCVM